MTDAEIIALLSSCGVPVAYRDWGNPADNPEAPPLPYILAYSASDADTEADNGAWIARPWWVVEIYSRNRDASLEQAVKNALNTRPDVSRVTRNEVGRIDSGAFMTALYFDTIY